MCRVSAKNPPGARAGWAANEQLDPIARLSLTLVNLDPPEPGGGVLAAPPFSTPTTVQVAACQ